MFVRLEEPKFRRSRTPGWAPLALGFRPFYLLAALFAAIAIAIWVAIQLGVLELPLPGMWWHAHEMVFGFVAAVVTGFLFTAGRNWTGLPTPQGMPLALLVLLWVSGRVAMAVGSGTVVALVDGAFLPLVTLILARLLWRRRQSPRNYFVPVLTGLLATANIAFHLTRLGLLELDPLLAIQAGLAVVVVLETVIGGRVTPGFTATAVKGVWQWRSPGLDLAVILLTAATLAGWLAGLSAHWVACIALLAALLHLLRAWGWNPAAARGQPLLWILHLGNAWIPVGLILLAGWAWAGLPRSAPLHALAIGATGSLVIGMITRTALGHTGRDLIVGWGERTAYLLVTAAALLRVLTLTVLPGLAFAGMLLAAACWITAFLIYALRYGPWLLRTRVDGQPG
jgi:uncharacterized protein involved in response to NO